jgi:hypothetical protein
MHFLGVFSTIIGLLPVVRKSFGKPSKPWQNQGIA